MGVIYVPNTDLIHFCMDTHKVREDMFCWIQETIVNWGTLLLASGGALKPAKCFFHLISFKFRADGTWAYKDNKLDEDLCVVVPLTDGSFAIINHLGVHKSTKMLGSMTCPSGCNKEAIKYMLTKSRAWRDLSFGMLVTCWQHVAACQNVANFGSTCMLVPTQKSTRHKNFESEITNKLWIM